MVKIIQDNNNNNNNPIIQVEVVRKSNRPNRLTNEKGFELEAGPSPFIKQALQAQA